MTADQRVHVQALVAWLGRAVSHPELAAYMVTGTQRLCDYLADQLRRGQQTGQVLAEIDPDLAAAGYSPSPTASPRMSCKTSTLRPPRSAFSPCT